MLVEVLLFVLAVAYFYNYFKKPKYLPPGTFGLPFIGCLPASGVHIYDWIRGMKEKYGSVFTVKWGTSTVVILTDPIVIKKVFDSPDFAGRPSIFAFGPYRFGQKAGILFVDGDEWKRNRRFILHNLRNFGMGKSYLESAMVNEVENLVEYLENFVDKAADMDCVINLAVVNVLWQMIASERGNLEDESSRAMATKIYENMGAFQELMVLTYFPLLYKLVPMPIYNRMFPHYRTLQNNEDFFTFCKKLINDHKKNLDKNNPRDLIDNYLIDREDSADDNYEDLLSIMQDLFAAGSETTATTIRWFIIYMALHPEVQKKVHKELDEVVSRDRCPTFADRLNLPYVDAVLCEVQRLAPQLGVGLPHRATKTLTIEGYTIPKDTTVYGITEACHKDPKYWQKPTEFYPEHFLNADGSLNTKNPAFMPFAIGKRQCLGEGLGRAQTYLFCTAILQRFTVEPAEGVTTEKDPRYTLINTPKPHKILLRKRTVS